VVSAPVFRKRARHHGSGSLPVPRPGIFSVRPTDSVAHCSTDWKSGGRVSRVFLARQSRPARAPGSVARIAHESPYTARYGVGPIGRAK